MIKCRFCQIVGGERSADIVYQDQQIMAFNDCRPRSPVHLLIIPKEHIPSLNQVEDGGLLQHMIKTAIQLSRDHGISDSGYRLVINTGRDGRQIISHLHLHLRGGKQLRC